MRKKDEFRKYFASFVEELSKGFMNKRIILKKLDGSESNSEMSDIEEWKNFMIWLISSLLSPLFPLFLPIYIYWLKFMNPLLN